MKNIVVRALTGVALVATVIHPSSTAFAGSHTWSGAVNGNWSVPGNWSSGGAPVAGEAGLRLTFPAGPVRLAVTNNIGPLLIETLSVLGDGYSLAGASALTFTEILGNNLSCSGAGVVIASPVILNGTARFSVGSGNSLYLRQPVQGSGNLTKYGGGLLVFQAPGPNTFAGGLHVYDGVLELQGGAVSVPGPVTIGDPAAVGAAPILRLANNDQIADGATVTIHGNGELECFGFEDTVGPLHLPGGRVSVQNGFLGLNATVNSSGLAEIKGPGWVRLNSATRAFHVSNSTCQVSASLIDGAGFNGGLVKSGAGTLALSSSNAFSGPVAVNEGVLVAGHARSLGAASSGTSVNDGGTLALPGGITFSGEGLGLNGTGAGGQGALRITGTGSTWTGPMGLGSDAVVSVPNANHAFTIGSGISGLGRLVKQGAGVLVFSGVQANTCLGGVQVDSGTLNLQKLPGVNSVLNQLTVGTTNGAPGSAVVQLFSDNQVADTAAVFVDYSGKFDLGVKSDTVGALTLRGGTVSSTVGTLTLNGDVTTLPPEVGGGTPTNSIRGRLSLGSAPRTFAVHSWLEIDAAISGASLGAGFTKTGNHYLVLRGSNTYQGVTSIASGGVLPCSDTAFGATNSGTVVHAGGFIHLAGDRHIGAEALSLAGPGFWSGTLGSYGSNSWAGPVTVAADAVVGVFDDGGAITSGVLILGGALRGGGNLRKFGSAPLVLAGSTANSLSGTLTVTEGELFLAKTNAVAIAGPLVIGTTNTTQKTTFVREFASGQIADPVVVSVLPTGTLDLNGFSDLIGGLALQAGDVTTGSGVLYLDGDVVGEGFTYNQASQVSHIKGQVALGGAYQLLRTTNGAVVEIAANLIDGGGIGGMVVTGNGYVVLSGTNTFQGPVEVNAGQLHLANSHALGTPLFGTLLTNDAMLVIGRDNLAFTGESLTLAGGAEFGAQLLNYGSNTLWTGSVRLAGNSLVGIHPPDSSLELRGPISGPGGFTATGAGRLLLSGNQANTYTGETGVAEGTLLLSKTNATAIPGPLVLGNPWFSLPLHQAVRHLRPNQLADTSRVTVHRGFWTGVPAQLDLNGFSDTIGSLDGAGDVTLGAGSLTLGANGDDSQFNGTVSGSGATCLVKTGGGTFTLAGHSPCSGATLISQGALLVNGSLSNSPVTVAANGAVGGTGIVKTLAVNGIVRPGPAMTSGSFGRITSLGSLNLAPGSDYRCELGGQDAGVNFDQIRASGSVVLNNATLKVSQHFYPTVSSQFMIIEVPVGGAAMGTFAGLPEGGVFSISPGRTFRITYHGGDGNDVVLTQVSIPQPAALGGLTKTPLGPRQVNGTGTPGSTYDVYATTNIASTNWLNLGAITADGTGALKFIDADSLVLPMRFYRLALP